MVRNNRKQWAFDFDVTPLHSFPDNGLAIEVNVKLWHVWYTVHIMLGLTCGPTDDELKRDN